MNKRLLCFLFACAISASALAQPTPIRDLPEPSSQTVAKKVAFAPRDMVAAAHPLAVDAALDMLRKGGSAIDAAVAAQMVLNLVEPQSSGIGGGAFLVHYDATHKRTLAYDGRETVPASATASLFLGEDGKPMRFGDAVRSGKAVGVPGVLRMLEAAHAAHGKLAWATLFEPAIKLATLGYPLSQRTAQQAANSQILRANPATKALFFSTDGTPKPVGTVVTNPALAKTMQAIAARGADAFYRGEIAERMVATVRAHARPGSLSLEDLSSYRTRISEPVCGGYRGHRLCGMPMPSGGTVAVLQMLAILERFPLKSLAPDSLQAVHLFAEAGRLAYADRERFAADDRFAEVPVSALLAPAYLNARAALVREDKSMGRAAPGTPGVKKIARGHTHEKETGTSHFSVVDAFGNGLSMTTSVESSFGSQLFVDGFFLNNQLTDFSFNASDADGVPIANAVYPGKRPRSTMSPFIVFDESGAMKMLIGSALGSAIANLNAKTIVGVLDWGLDIQSAISLPNMGSSNGPTILERGTSIGKLEPALKAMGHETRVADIPSGLHGIVRVRDGWQGGADPRREGIARGR